jgi:N-acetyl-anhydromuramyl-L-alanine amidase AmpD
MPKQTVTLVTDCSPIILLSAVHELIHTLEAYGYKVEMAEVKDETTSRVTKLDI